jgi:hypothetical protein
LINPLKSGGIENHAVRSVFLGICISLEQGKNSMHFELECLPGILVGKERNVKFP